MLRTPVADTSRMLLAAVLAAALPGCTAVALPAVGTAVVASGAGSVVRVGTEYTLSGAAYRTFSHPIHVVRGAALQALDAAGVTIAANETTEDGSRILAEVHERTITVTLESLAPSLTRMRLSVRQDLIRRDRATASEIIAQTVARLPRMPTMTPVVDRADDQESREEPASEERP